jgi:hypothetical protein
VTIDGQLAIISLDPLIGQTKVRMATHVQINAHMKCVSELFRSRLSISNIQTEFQSLFILNQGQKKQIRQNADNSGQKLCNTEGYVSLPSCRTAENFKKAGKDVVVR